MYWALLFLAVMAATLLVTVAVYYVLFRQSAAGRWQHGVRLRRDEAIRLRARLNRDLSAAAQEEDEAIRPRRQRAFQTHLQSIPVSDLAQYPGIGPATVERLSAAGFRRVADLRGARLNIPGLGAKRIADLNQALEGVLQAAQSRFDAGACREAAELAAELSGLRQRRRAREEAARLQLKAVEEFLAALQPALDAATRISFWKYLSEQFRGSPEGTVEVAQEAPLPDLEHFLQAARKPAAAITVEPAIVDATPATAAPAERGGVALPAEPRSRGRLPDEPFPLARSGGDWTAAEAARPAVCRTADELEMVVAFAFAVARADGRLARSERDTIESFLRRRCGDDAARVNRALALCAHYETAAIDLEECLKFLAGHGTAHDRGDLYRFALDLADTAGARNDREKAFLERVARAFNITVEPAPLRAVNGTPAAAPAAATPRAEHFAVLEIDAAAPLTADLVRRKFNLLSERLAPERLAHAGKEFEAMAQAKLAAVRSAATALLAELGEAIEAPAAAAAPADLRHNPDLDALFGAR